MEDVVKQRLVMFIKSKHMKQYQFEQTIGVSSGYITSIRKSIGADKLFRIQETYPELNINWLLYGEGDMLNELPQEAVDEGSTALLNVAGSANLVSLHTSQEKQDIIGHIKVPCMPKCDYALFVSGDSMSPLLKSGDIVAVKEVPNEVQSIIYGEMYLVSVDICGDEYLAIKFIHRSDKGEEWIRLTSYNDFYEPKDVHLSQVKYMALVKFSIRKQTMI